MTREDRFNNKFLCVGINNYHTGRIYMHFEKTEKKKKKKENLSMLQGVRHYKRHKQQSYGCWGCPTN